MRMCSHGEAPPPLASPAPKLQLQTSVSVLVATTSGVQTYLSSSALSSLSS